MIAFVNVLYPRVNLVIHKSKDFVGTSPAMSLLSHCWCRCCDASELAIRAPTPEAVPCDTIRRTDVHWTVPLQVSSP